MYSFSDLIYAPTATAEEELKEGNANRGLEYLFIRCHRAIIVLEPFGLLSAAHVLDLSHMHPSPRS